MNTKIYNVLLEVEDLSDSDGEDIEAVIEEILTEHLPSDLTAHILEVTDESIG